MFHFKYRIRVSSDRTRRPFAITKIATCQIYSTYSFYNLQTETNEIKFYRKISERSTVSKPHPACPGINRIPLDRRWNYDVLRPWQNRNSYFTRWHVNPAASIPGKSKRGYSRRLAAHGLSRSPIEEHSSCRGFRQLRTTPTIQLAYACVSRRSSMSSH